MFFYDIFFPLRVFAPCIITFLLPFIAILDITISQAILIAQARSYHLLLPSHAIFFLCCSQKIFLVYNCSRD